MPNKKSGPEVHSTYSTILTVPIIARSTGKSKTFREVFGVKLPLEGRKRGKRMRPAGEKREKRRPRLRGDAFWAGKWGAHRLRCSGEIARQGDVGNGLGGDDELAHAHVHGRHIAFIEDDDKLLVTVDIERGVGGELGEVPVLHVTV